MSSHLLGEIERVCDSLVVIDGGKLVRSGEVAEFTATLGSLEVEVEGDAGSLAEALAERGFEARGEGFIAHVGLNGADPYDAIRDCVVELEMGLVRLEQRRQSLEDIFRPDSIEAEERLDGLYVIRTNLEEEQLGDAGTVRAYKSLARVERAFRSLKSLLAVRPVFHWKERRVRAHLLICLLAYYLEWHMRERLAPLLFVDEEKAEGEAGPVGPAQRSEAGQRKDSTRRTLAGDLPLHSFEDLLEHLGGQSAAELRLEVAPEQRVAVVSAMTSLQKRAFQLLGIKPHPAPPAELLATERTEA